APRSQPDLRLRGGLVVEPSGRDRDENAVTELYCVFHFCVAAGHEGRVCGHGRQPGKIERTRHRCLPWRARQGWLARTWRPLDLSAITGRAATYRPLDVSLVVSPPPRAVASRLRRTAPQRHCCAKPL